ncbi:MAG: hypothetical protein NVS4B6_15920 [Mycobacterium sp.]
MLRIARVSAVGARAKVFNALKDLIVTAPAELREQLAGRHKLHLIGACTALATSGIPSTPAEAVSVALKSLAGRCLALDAETKAQDTQIEALTAHACPALRQVYGFGPDTAATLLVALGDNPERIGSDAAFAKLCGVSPIETSSGKPCGTDLTEAETATPTAPCTSSALSDSAATNPLMTTSPAASAKAGQKPKSCAA